MKDLLQRGNIIKIQKGMKVYANIQSKFVFSNRPLSDELYLDVVEVGKTYTISKEDKENFVEEVKRSEVKKLQEQNFNVTEKQIDELLRDAAPNLKTEEYDSSVLIGEYVITRTECSGGGTAMGVNDVYPDGWKVFAKKIRENKIDHLSEEISFYQTGAFTAMILPEEIEFVRDIFD